MSDNQALLDLQVKLAFLEDSLSKLSDEYYAQQKELQKLSLTVDALLDKLARVEGESSVHETVIDEAPPHY